MPDAETEVRLDRLERSVYARSMGMAVRYLHDAAELLIMDSPVAVPLPNVNDIIELRGKEYLILWRRWRYEKIDKVSVDIGLELSLR